MLVLSRKIGESIDVGEDVKVVVLSLRGEAVKLGVEAPREIAVDRSEVRAAQRRAGDAAWRKRRAPKDASESSFQN